jgi:hypothetical protein
VEGVFARILEEKRLMADDLLRYGTADKKFEKW